MKRIIAQSTEFLLAGIRPEEMDMVQKLFGKAASISKLFGMRFCNLCFLYALVIVVRYFSLYTTRLGWCSTTALLLILGGITLMVLGMMGEYIGKIYRCINATPQYVIRDLVRKEN